MGWGITGTLLSGIVVWGGIGLALDQWWGTRFFVMIGVLLGLTAAIYLVVVKYGDVTAPPARRPLGTTAGGPGRGRRPADRQDQMRKGQR